MITKALLAVTLFLIFGCSGNSEQTKEQTTEVKSTQVAAYSCPMQCEGDKTYSDSGKCPVCKMELQEVAFQGADSVKHQH
ncbi:heavy metal-binding domain-containing protein [Dyadobacter aurulentus]|uniref:heavy metal-binding domain-containing protein n=1 Tax=Dyadobacter sp. UC 10 TaxID=2605428 RepID=UPI0011F0C258|nr:heavy metal-binding domain-containing protein [Dyadobacter sp. UC 10]KAA0989847.1 hypothetical protein FXO21_06540 [Dyadobacter sp. UC 10]